MKPIQLKRNVGRTDMIIRILLGSILISLGAFRVFPGSYAGAAVAVIAGGFLLVEGALRY